MPPEVRFLTRKVGGNSSTLASKSKIAALELVLLMTNLARKKNNFMVLEQGQLDCDVIPSSNFWGKWNTQQVTADVADRSSFILSSLKDYLEISFHFWILNHFKALLLLSVTVAVEQTEYIFNACQTKWPVFGRILCFFMNRRLVAQCSIKKTKGVDNEIMQNKKKFTTSPDALNNHIFIL